MSSLRRFFGANSDLLLVAGMIGILIVLFTPVSARTLDFLLLLNLSFALLLLLMTFYIERPVEFSTYPSLLLIATLFRLSLNIAATRLILSDADGGKVIGAIGSYVVGGNYVIGLIVFLILVVVQYVVVTNGAQRVAEVAARFTLDSMPGQQMSIDADLNMGFIDQAEAQRRRKEIEKEAHFYGSMDGASKFVKGDAIAGIVILLIDILGGLAIGVMQLGMSWPEAAQTFTLLTIGDGIVTQVPALVIAVGTGIIVTRSGTDSHLSREILGQIVSFPKALGLVAIALVGIGLLPGIPLLPIVILALALGGTFWAVVRAKARQAAPATPEGGAPATEESLADLLTVEPIEIRVGQNLVSLINTEDAGLSERIVAFRKQYALESGLVMPKVKMRDDKRLAANTYQIQIFGVTGGESTLESGHWLAIHPTGTTGSLVGVETRDPTYGLPAVWIDESQKATARAAGFTLVDPVTVFVTHLTEVMKRNAQTLLTRSMVGSMVDRLRENNPGLIEEIVPGVMSLVEIQKVLQNLLKEKVSIRHLEGILEVLADEGRHSKSPEHLTEAIRQRLGAAICQSLAAGKPELSVLTLDPAIEQRIASSLRGNEEAKSLVLEPKFAETVLGRLAGQTEQMVKQNVQPVLLCAPELRRHIRSITERVLPQLAVLSMAEVPPSMNLRSFAVVKA